MASVRGALLSLKNDGVRGFSRKVYKRISMRMLARRNKRKLESLFQSYESGAIESFQQGFIDFYRDRDKKLALTLITRLIRSGEDDMAVSCCHLLMAELAENPKALRSLTVKMLAPVVYSAFAERPIDHKVLIMEKGHGISGSYSCLIPYLRERTDFEVLTMALEKGSPDKLTFYKRVLDYIRQAATSEAVFNCTSNEFMGYIKKLRTETTYIQLWHGCGILKKVGRSTIGYSFGKSAKGHKEYPLNRNYTYVTLASPEQEWIYEEAMALDANSGVLVSTGISRTDVFFDKEFLDNARLKLESVVPAAKEKKIILYAPTFRGEVAQAQGPTELDIHKMATELGNDYILIVKHHQCVKITPELPEAERDTFAFDLTRGKGLSINQLMSVADVMITDYSSVAFEYSLFERPMLFFTFDMEDYNDARGLYYDLEEFLPGPILRTSDEVIECLKTVGNDFDLTAIKEFRERFMCNCDGHSTERIVNLIGTKPKSRI